jgi:DNA-binding winged helix-turn-helix (wHTH) protein
MIEKLKDGLILEERTSGKSRLRYGDIILPHKPSMVLITLLESGYEMGRTDIITKVWGDYLYDSVYVRNTLRVSLTKIRKFLKDIDSEYTVAKTSKYNIKLVRNGCAKLL